MERNRFYFVSLAVHRNKRLRDALDGYAQASV
jgi:hypothetical protein